MSEAICRVYWNIHKACWSVKADGKPIQHATRVLLKDGFFKVWQGGRARVLRERKKNVHAFACGVRTFDLALVDGGLPPGFVQVSYNPFRMPEIPGHFYRKDTGKRVERARWLFLGDNARVFAYEPTGSDVTTGQ